VGIVLAWMLDEGDGSAHGCTNWEEYPFILCDHRGLREMIYQHRRDAGATLTDFQLSGKHISPRDLRESADFDRLLLVVSRKRKDLKEKAHLRLTTEHLKGEAVAHRLALFDALCGKKVTHLARNVVVSGEFVDLQSFGVIESNVRMAPEEFL